MAKITINTEDETVQRSCEAVRPADQEELLTEIFNDNLPPPPLGYRSWLDYAVEGMDTRTAFLELCVTEGQDAPSRESMRAAVRKELKELRRRAGDPVD